MFTESVIITVHSGIEFPDNVLIKDVCMQPIQFMETKLLYKFGLFTYMMHNKKKGTTSLLSVTRYMNKTL